MMSGFLWIEMIRKWTLQGGAEWVLLNSPLTINLYMACVLLETL